MADIRPVISDKLGIIWFMVGVWCGAVAVVLAQNGFYPTWSR